jgi:hypothetical protein
MPNGDVTLEAFDHQHVDNGFRRVIAKKLPTVFFVKGNPVLLNQPNEIAGLEFLKGRADELRVLGKKVGWTAIKISEIATTAATDSNFFSQGLCVVKHKNTKPVLPSRRCTEKSGCACADNNNIPRFRPIHDS